MHGAGHVVLVQIGRHRGAEYVHPAVHQRVRIERDRIAERRNPDARGKRRGLVMVVEHLRIIFELGAGDHLRLDHVVHVAVAIVIVADVFLPQPGRVAHLVRRAEIAAVPFGHLILAIGIDGEPEQQDHVVENGGGFGVLAADQVVGELDGDAARARLRWRAGRHRCGRSRLAVVGELVRLRVVESFDQREAAGGVFDIYRGRRDSCAEEMMAMYQSRPRVVLPTRTSLSLSVDWASFWK